MHCGLIDFSISTIIQTGSRKGKPSTSKTGSRKSNPQPVSKEDHIVPPEPPLVPHVVPYRDYRGLEGVRGTPHPLKAWYLGSCLQSVRSCCISFHSRWLLLCRTVLHFFSDSIFRSWALLILVMNRDTYSKDGKQAKLQAARLRIMIMTDEECSTTRLWRGPWVRPWSYPGMVRTVSHSEAQEMIFLLVSPTLICIIV